MGKLSNIFGVLALLLAGAAAFFSFTISSRRAEFRLRADKMATAVVDIVKKADEGSGTALASQVTFTPGDPKARTKDSGSLSSVKFHEAKDEAGAFAAFQEQLDKAVSHVGTLAERRNDLAKVLTATVTTLGLPADYLAEAELCDLSDPQVFGDASQKVQSHADAVQRRDMAMIAALEAAAQVVGERIDRNALTARKQDQDDEGRVEYGDYQCDTTLSNLQTGVKALDERATAYAQTLVSAMGNVKRHQGVFEWSVSPADVRSKNKASYDPAHVEFINDFVKLNEQLDNLVAARVEIAEKKRKIDALETDLSAANAKVKEAQGVIAAKDAQIRALERELAKYVKPKDDGTFGGEKEPEGLVCRVDPEFNYVVVNLGTVDGVVEGTELLVARGDEYVAKVQVAQALDRLSVADIMPLAAAGTVKPDDRVILAVPAKRGE